LWGSVRMPSGRTPSSSQLLEVPPMKSALRRSALVLSLCLVCACSTDDGPAETPDTSGSEDTTEVEEVAETPALAWLEIRDSAEAIAALDCDDTSTPGADIDAGILYSTPTFADVVATLSECAWAEAPSACDVNIFGEPAAANGDKDASPGGGFVALNGGTLRCRWSNGGALSLGNVLQVLEISAAGATEAHDLRACRDAEGTDCGVWVTSSKAGQTHPAGSLFF
jgi:hypothetical protein